MTTTVADLTADLERVYPPHWAESWDAVGLVCGRGDREVTKVSLAVDCVPATVAEAAEIGAQLLLVHHPLLLRGVSTVAPDTYKGEIVHTLIESGIALYVAHTNADVANPGVSDALAHRLGLTDLRPLVPVEDTDRGIGRVGRLPAPETLEQFTARAAAALPPTAWGVRAAGDPRRLVQTVAVSGGAGDSYLGHATAAGADVYLTADLRHHPVSEHLEAAGPALVDAAHWATEWPWLEAEAARIRAAFDVATVVSDRNTDPWTLHRSST
ncbi:Nif3-like dinuclear metal center hexameric protein [Stackebrandtia nassauensis]|nr:Nif3-like dinuclear metal center hexameric protein [Stackebrandtia nassauensis]